MAREGRLASPVPVLYSWPAVTMLGPRMIKLDLGNDGMFWLLVCSERSFAAPEGSEQWPGQMACAFILVAQ